MDDFMNEANIEEEAPKGILDDEPEKTTHLPYAVWKVGGREIKLKLTTPNIIKLERKYGKNILNLISDDGIPPLDTMLTVIQAAALPYNHGISFEKAQELYDKYTEEGGDQMKLLADVIYSILAVSGFFTENQKTNMQAILKDLDSPL